MLIFLSFSICKIFDFAHCKIIKQKCLFIIFIIPIFIYITKYFLSYIFFNTIILLILLILFILFQKINYFLFYCSLICFLFIHNWQNIDNHLNLIRSLQLRPKLNIIDKIYICFFSPYFFYAYF